jgi:hypothetical protein
MGEIFSRRDGMDVAHSVRPGGPGEHQRADAREANRGRMPRFA